MTYTFRKSLPIFLLAAATISTSTMAMQSDGAVDNPGDHKVAPVHHHKTAAEGFDNFVHNVSAGLKEFEHEAVKVAHVLRREIDHDLPTIVQYLNLSVAGLQVLEGMEGDKLPGLPLIIRDLKKAIADIDEAQQVAAAVKIAVASSPTSNPAAAVLVNAVIEPVVSAEVTADTVTV